MVMLMVDLAKKPEQMAKTWCGPPVVIIVANS